MFQWMSRTGHLDSEGMGGKGQESRNAVVGDKAGPWKPVLWVVHKNKHGEAQWYGSKKTVGTQLVGSDNRPASSPPPGTTPCNSDSPARRRYHLPYQGACALVCQQEYFFCRIPRGRQDRAERLVMFNSYLHWPGMPSLLNFLAMLLEGFARVSRRAGAPAF